MLVPPHHAFQPSQNVTQMSAAGAVEEKASPAGDSEATDVETNIERLATALEDKYACRLTRE